MHFASRPAPAALGWRPSGRRLESNSVPLLIRNICPQSRLNILSREAAKSDSSLFTAFSPCSKQNLVLALPCTWFWHVPKPMHIDIVFESEQPLAAAHLVVRIRLIPGKWMYLARLVPVENKSQNASGNLPACTEFGALEDLTRKQNCDDAADLGRSSMKTTFVFGSPFPISRAMRFKLSVTGEAAALSGGTAHFQRSAQ